jgi:uncharacterized protein YjdB
MKNLATILVICICIGITGCGGSSKSASTQTASITTISVGASASSLSVGQTLQLAAIATYSDKSTKDVTSTATWQSSDPTIATISSSGRLTATKAGTVTVMATVGTTSGSLLITVKVGAPTVTAVSVSAASSSLGVGRTLQLTATATYSDKSTKDVTSSATWQASDSTIATVSSSGLLTAVKVGTLTVTANVGAVVSAPSTFTVTAAVLSSIEVTPLNASIATGQTQQFTANGIFSDGSTIDITNQVTWSSDALGVATVSAGLASGISAGTANINASSGTVVGTAVPLTVTSAVLQSIAISDVQPIGIGGQVQFTVTGTFTDSTTQDISNATITSADTSIATVDNTGWARGVAAGDVIITATAGGFSDTTTLTVTPATLESIAITPLNTTVAPGTTSPFTLTGVFSDGSTEALTQNITWSSSLLTVATIDGNGLASAISAGVANIGATYQSLSAPSATLTVGAIASIKVTPLSPAIGIGGTQQFTATAVFTDNSSQDVTSQVTWKSSPSSVALISDAGLANAVGAGTAQITASFQNFSGSATLTVSAARLASITVTPGPTLEAPTRTKIQFTATGVFSDGSTATPLSGVRWYTSSASHANISGSGLARTKKTGTVTVSATLNSAAGKVTGQSTITVENCTVTSVGITPLSATIAPGATQQFALNGTCGGTQLNLSRSAYWHTSNYLDAVVSNSGLVTAVADGSVTITATYQGVSYTAQLTVQ